MEGALYEERVTVGSFLGCDKERVLDSRVVHSFFGELGELLFPGREPGMYH